MEELNSKAMQEERQANQLIKKYHQRDWEEIMRIGIAW